MEKKNTVGLAVVILNSLCAGVWNINVLIDLAYGFPNAAHIFCAIVWNIVSVIWIVRFIKSKQGKE